MLIRASSIRFNAGHLALGAAVAALSAMALAAPSDRRLGLHNAGLSEPHNLRAALRSGPIVAPVKRRQPVMPPWPHALVAAGDIVPPALAPDMAPLPARKDAALASARRTAAAQPRPSATTLAASSGKANAASQPD